MQLLCQQVKKHFQIDIIGNYRIYFVVRYDTKIYNYYILGQGRMRNYKRFYAKTVNGARCYCLWL